jgi:hypothetical protein
MCAPLEQQTLAVLNHNALFDRRGAHPAASGALSHWVGAT